MRATLFLVVLAAAAAGCDRTHLRPATYGQAVRRAIAAQVINPAAGERRTRDDGLDPEEAAIVSKSYRESLSPKKEETVRAPMIVTPAPSSGMPLLPAAGGAAAR